MAVAPTSTNAPARHSRMKVLSVGLPRTGSASMARALEMLGYEHVHHSMRRLDNSPEWGFYSRACDASFPALNTYTGEPVDWDEVFGDSDAATDMAGIFTVPMIKAYPDAKVILVERAFDPWSRSVDNIITKACTGWINHLWFALGPSLGLWQWRGGVKVWLGLLGANTVDECRANLRRVHAAHSDKVRAAVADRPDRLLEYHPSQGWAPLCAFLGREVPEGVEFPRLNEQEEMQRELFALRGRQNRTLGRMVLPWAAAVGVACVAFGVRSRLGGIIRLIPRWSM